MTEAIELNDQEWGKIRQELSRHLSRITIGAGQNFNVTPLSASLAAFDQLVMGLHSMDPDATATLLEATALVLRVGDDTPTTTAMRKSAQIRLLKAGQLMNAKAEGSA